MLKSIRKFIYTYVSTEFNESKIAYIAVEFDVNS